MRLSARSLDRSSHHARWISSRLMTRVVSQSQQSQWRAGALRDGHGRPDRQGVSHVRTVDRRREDRGELGDPFRWGRAGWLRNAPPGHAGITATSCRTATSVRGWQRSPPGPFPDDDAACVGAVASTFWRCSRCMRASGPSAMSARDSRIRRSDASEVRPPGRAGAHALALVERHAGSEPRWG